MTDTLGDQRVDYMYFGDTGEVFMYQADSELPGDRPMHRCAQPMEEDVVMHSSRLLYGEDLSLLQEMDVKRRLLLSYMSAKGGVDTCYGGDSRTGVVSGQQSPDESFAEDDFEWGEDWGEE